MVAPVFSPSSDTGHRSAEEDFFFCGSCRVPYPDKGMLTTVQLPNPAACFGCGQKHVTETNICPSCFTIARDENLSDLTRHVYGESRPERRRLARFIIDAVRKHKVGV